MRKPALVKYCFLGPGHRLGDRRPTGGAIHFQTPSSWKCFLSLMTPTADSPCFHSHSELEHFRSGACWRPQSINRCCHLRLELNVSLGNLRSSFYSQSPELGDWLLLCQNPIPLCCCLPGSLHRWSRLAVPQRFIHFPRYPQPMQQNRQLPRHRHHGPLLGVLATTCA